MFDGEKFINSLPNEKGYKADKIKVYIDVLINEAKKHI